jgi:thiosulfate/3-mercaptopyruvate sulfurtransferase
MTYTTLITAQQLLNIQAEGTPHKIFDCSFDLNQPDAGMAMFTDVRIACAVYAHLDHDLSAKTTAQRANAASGGRHPLPAREQVADWLGRMGFENNMQAVVYDRQGNNFCGRLWWMLKWVGHEAVAILDGGLHAWQAAGGAMRSGLMPRTRTKSFTMGAPLVSLRDVNTVQQQLGSQQTIIDARAPARFKGETEPIDPVAGHIPGALNRPFSLNMTPEGFFKPPAVLRQEFEALLAGRDPATVVHQCGSGVSALPNLVAMQIAGLVPGTLFAGSWSEWCSNSERPVEKG